MASMPYDLYGFPDRGLLISPSDSGSIPESKANSISPSFFKILYIKSVPMFPDPKIPTLILAIFFTTSSLLIFKPF